MLYFLLTFYTIASKYHNEFLCLLKAILISHTTILFVKLTFDYVWLEELASSTFLTNLLTKSQKSYTVDIVLLMDYVFSVVISCLFAAVVGVFFSIQTEEALSDDEA